MSFSKRSSSQRKAYLLLSHLQHSPIKFFSSLFLFSSSPSHLFWMYVEERYYPTCSNTVDVCWCHLYCNQCMCMLIPIHASPTYCSRNSLPSNQQSLATALSLMTLNCDNTPDAISERTGHECVCAACLIAVCAIYHHRAAPHGRASTIMYPQCSEALRREREPRIEI